MRFSNFLQAAAAAAADATGVVAMAAARAAAAAAAAAAAKVASAAEAASDVLGISIRDGVEPEVVSFDDAEVVPTEAQRLAQERLLCAIRLIPGVAIHPDYGCVTRGLLPGDDDLP
jgi:hypothetical protein